MDFSKVKILLKQIADHEAFTMLILIAAILGTVGVMLLFIKGLSLAFDSHVNIFVRIIIGAILLGFFILGARMKYVSFCRQNGITRGQKSQESNHEFKN
ncbi:MULTISPECIES: hypothetical protein [Cysteiniphilum]|uniref:Uncharacterized protein n=1 Tax=Cysteiniphilum litorale TaxID=2056700 RepID=A0A8J2Z331_9GAMM|nr:MULTISPECIES: hypothetical protein [Cysteiniphilum]GGF91785.1 hypothetical protein GCM10010995_06220 [Cysteiniphilum litorale]